MFKKGILVVSFGTSEKETGPKGIDGMEQAMELAYPDSVLYRAYTSQRIVRKLRREGIEIDTVTEVMQKIVQDEINELIVQPTYLTPGMENDRMLQDILPFQNQIGKIYIGAPLLNRKKDYKELAQIVNQSIMVEDDEVLFLMGHGSSYFTNMAYPVFADALRKQNSGNIIIGTLEGSPSFEDSCKELKKCKEKKVCLLPLMMVAGRHVTRDMAGDTNSWFSRLTEAGYQVRCICKGLGEYPQVQQMFVRHVHEAREKGRQL